MKRTPIKRTPMKPGRKRMRQVSPKQAVKNASRKPVRDAYLAAHPNCEARVSQYCTVRSTDVHEPWTRKRGGPTDDPLNMLALCPNCHGWVHGYPEAATANGWLVSAEAGPAWLAERRDRG